MNTFKYIVFGLILTCVSLLLTWHYRPYIYENNIDDFYIADTLGSIFAMPAAVFFLFGLSRKKILTNGIVIKIYAGFILYELLSLTGFHGTFDIKDIAALTLSMLLLLSLPQGMRVKK